MSRRSKPAKRVPLADPVYNSVDISKFINRIMRRGKKSLAEKIFYATLNKIEERTGEKSRCGDETALHFGGRSPRRCEFLR